MLESLQGVSVSALLGDLALLQLTEEASVVLRITQNCDTLVVLRSSADESNAANVNLLNSFWDADVDLGNGVLEGVEVADDEVDLVDVLVGQVLLIGSEVASEDAGVDGRVEGLDTACEHLGGLCDGRNIPRSDNNSQPWLCPTGSIVPIERGLLTRQGNPTRGSSWRYRLRRECGHSAEQDP